MKFFPLPVLLFCLCSALGGAELKILCTSDLHGELPRLSALAPAIRSGGKEALRIDAGDLVSGNYYAEYSGGKSMTGALNRLGYDVFVPGNHDFELGFESFRNLLADFRGTVLGAEWEWNGIRPAAWKLFRRNGISVAVIGMSDPKMPSRVLPGNGTLFREPYAVLEGVLKELRRVRPEVIVLVWHQGLFGTPRMADVLRHFPEIDLVIAGHSHQEIPGNRIHGSWVVQPGSHASAVAEVTVEVEDSTRKIRRITSKLLRPTPAAPDPDLKQWADLSARPLKKSAWEPLEGFRSGIQAPRQGEFQAPFGVFTAESIRKKSGAQAAVVMLRAGNGKRFPFCRHSVFRLMPYRNIICTAELSRAELKALAEWCDATGKKYGQIPFFSGFAVRRTGKGALSGVDAPEKLTVALSDHLLVSVPALRPVLTSSPKRWRSTGVVEREALFPAATP